MDPIHFIPARTLASKADDPDRFYDENGCEWLLALRAIPRLARRLLRIGARRSTSLAKIARPATQT